MRHRARMLGGVQGHRAKPLESSDDVESHAVNDIRMRGLEANLFAAILGDDHPR